MLARILRRFRVAAADPSPIVQAVTNNGCSFESCGEPWQGHEWHGWRLCAGHYAETLDRAAVRV